MALSRKRERELDRLRDEAAGLWEDQKEVIERANRVIRDASRHARNYTRDEVSPRVRDAYKEKVRPTVASALGSASAIIDAAKDPKLRATVTRAAKRRGAAAMDALPKRSKLVEKSKSRGPGGYILLGVGIVAALGIAYAAWQTLRADDDLWIDDEELTEQTGDVQPS
jgi:hypothetical protein